MGTRTMRLIARKPVHLSVTALAILLLIYVGAKVNFFVHIFLGHSGVALTQGEIAHAHNATTPDPRAGVVPPIIHQIYHNWKDPGNETIPAIWDAARQTCIDLHPGWEYKVGAASRAVSSDDPCHVTSTDSYVAMDGENVAGLH